MSAAARLLALINAANAAIAENDSEAMRAIYDELDNIKPDHLTQAENDRCDRMMARLSDLWGDAL